MAGEFLRSHGIDIDSEMARIQFGQDARQNANAGLKNIHNVCLPKTPRGSRWDVHVEGGRVSEITPSDKSSPLCSQSPQDLDGHGCLLTPSLCHPHVHLDKAFILSHPKYAHLQIERGDFQEAMDLTGQAKAMFEEDDLLERGRRLIDESVEAGVTHMRAFVEVDAGVEMKCLDAGLKLRQEAWLPLPRCHIQLCAFAQLPLFTSSSGDEDGSVIRKLMGTAAKTQGVEVLGSTPYVEKDRSKMEQNVEWMIDLAIEHACHLDFHLDYNLDPETEPMVWHVVKMLKQKDWNSKTNKTVVLGHCTRLTLLKPEEWRQLRAEIGGLRVSFVGLPTSDLFMMRTPERVRGTLNVPELIQEHGLNACIGINNIGNAFTPQGSCDPLTLACNGVGIYQASTSAETELLFECVSTRAKAAIGLLDQCEEFAVDIATGQDADFLLFGEEKVSWRTRQTVQEAVQLYDHVQGRRSVLQGSLSA